MKIIGLRPGEKLFEELLIGGEVTKTQHDRVLRAVECKLPLEELTQIIEQLDTLCKATKEDEVLSLLEELPIDYLPWDQSSDCASP